MIVRERVPLAPLTTFGVGGGARFFIEASTEEDVRDAIAFAHERDLPLYLLGGGSNVLVGGDGFAGVVLQIKAREVTYETEEKSERVMVGAGKSWDEFVAEIVSRDLSGLECLSGIPGTVGGGIVQSVGAYGAQIRDTLVSVRAIDRCDADLQAVTFMRDECRLSYHDSLFGQQPGRYVILAATFLFKRGFGILPNYKDSRFDLAAFVGKEHRNPTLADVREAILEIRREKGVVADSYKSAGSFFHMPFVSKDQYEHLIRVAQKLDADMEERLRPWAWEQSDGTWKIAPGFLLEYTRFKKGYRFGEVGISPKHTLTIINHGGASAADVATLANGMRDAVADVFGLALEREVEYVGKVE